MPRCDPRRHGPVAPALPLVGRGRSVLALVPTLTVLVLAAAAAAAPCLAEPAAAPGAAAPAAARQPAPTQPAPTQTGAPATGDDAAGDPAAAVIRAVRAAATAYAAAYNARDARGLADQWTAGAQLEEGGLVIKGREAIAATLAGMRTANPDSAVSITVSGVQPLGATAARVQGTLAFTPRPGAETRVSHFDSLRVLEGNAWRIAQSRVVPTSRAALADLAWMVGAWRAADAATGGTIDATYERTLDGHALVGRITIARQDGPKLEALDVITADRATGLVRSLLVDSAGARAEGTFATDGITFNRTFEGAAADPTLGDRVRWVQVLAPSGPDGLLVHAIDRTIDGRPAPDRAPLHFRRVPPAAQPR